MTPPVGSVDAWIAELRTAALVGPARREVAEPPAELAVVRRAPEASREPRLLEAAAVVDVLLRAGARPAQGGTPVEPAPEDSRPVAGAQAAQLLHLLLTQPPMSRSARDDLLVEWLAAAEAAGRRVPEVELPRLLTHAATRPSVASALHDTLGERGRWLASLNPDWSALAGVDGSGAGADVRTAATDGRPAEDWASAWQTLPTVEAVAAFGQARLVDPAGARVLLETEWGSLAARLRSECTRLLTVGISPDDEPLLERALDDRARSVRESAWRALDQLPSSARGERMGRRLRSLLHVRGALRRTLEVDVPDDPDEAAVRDGLAPAVPGDVQPRAQWLETIIHGAPLSAWTEATGKDPATTVAMLRGDAAVLAAITSTVVRRGDREWAAALTARGVADPGLVPLLPAEQRIARLRAGLQAPTLSHEVREALHREPRPWDPALGRAVLQALTRRDAEPVAAALGAVLPTALPAELAPEVTEALAGLDPDSRTRRVLAETLQIHAFRTSLTEAFR